MKKCRFFIVEIVSLLIVIAVQSLSASGDSVVTSTTTATVKPTATPVIEINFPCKNYNKLVGECFTFRGRASYYNGNPSMRIWKIGTKRILGVCEYSCDHLSIPANLEKTMKGFNTEVYGIFTVCPIREFKEGHMQMVCICSVEIQRVVQRE